MTEIKIEKLSEEKLKDSSVSGQLLKELRRYIGFIRPTICSRIGIGNNG